MTRFGRLCIALFGSFAAILGAIRLVGAAHADPAAVLFSNLDGSSCPMPCLFGIQPGETTMGEAVKLVQAHPLISTMQQRPLTDDTVIYGVSLRAREVVIAIRAQKRFPDENILVDSISITPNLSADPTLPKTDPRLVDAIFAATSGGLFLHFGPPDVLQFSSDVGTSSNTRYMILYHMTAGLSAFVRLQKDPYTRRYSMTAQDNLEFLFVRGRTPGIGDYRDPWFGFISTEDYTRKLCQIQRRVLC